MFNKEVSNRFNSAQDSLVIQQSDFSLMAIYNMVENNSIDKKPHYQRRDRWPAEKQSALIESFLLNVPVPPIYLSEDDYGMYSVIDGKQRITAICDFLSDKLALKELKAFPELDGSRFSSLPLQMQNALTVRPYIRVTTLLRQSNPELKYEVFLRLNTGGEKLKPQEIRNVAYSGKLNDLLFELSENQFLKMKLKITSEKSAAYRSMDDVEHVLRFFTIRAGWEGKLGGVLSVEMDHFMAENRNGDIDTLRELFNKSINGCSTIWGDQAFQKPNGNGWREQLISPLYDAEMVAVSYLNQDQIDYLSLRSNDIIKSTKDLYDNDIEFSKSVSQSTNNPASIYRRVSTIRELLQNQLDK